MKFSVTTTLSRISGVDDATRKELREGRSVEHQGVLLVRDLSNYDGGGDHDVLVSFEFPSTEDIPECLGIQPLCETYFIIPNDTTKNIMVNNRRDGIVISAFNTSALREFLQQLRILLATDEDGTAVAIPDRWDKERVAK